MTDERQTHPHMTACRKCGSLTGNQVLQAHEDRCEGPPYICVAHAPWSKEIGGRAIHPDAKCVYSDSGHSLDDADRYECPNCHVRFWVEIPN